MATRKKKTTTKKAGSRRTSAGPPPNATGKHLVIVESPAKAKTINRYLGPDFVVQASVGHIRDLPTKAPKGSDQPVPGVDLEDDFRPTYEVLPGKKKVVGDLKKIARQASDIWFATDLDREGEAIAWHLSEVLGVDPTAAKRVVFNAITREEIQRAFADPHPIDAYKVNAQQARRILDRIVGYQVSPLLWKKVARGLSAGRVQSVAVRLIVEREREIRAFIPEEYWRVTARLALEPAEAAKLGSAWQRFLEQTSRDGRRPSQKAQNAWLTEQGAIKAELVELDGSKFELRSDGTGDDPSARVSEIADALGLLDVSITETDNPEGKGPARTLRTVSGRVNPAARYRVRSVDTKRTTSKPLPPFITSTLQMAAANALGFSAQRTMRTAQALYEGVEVSGEGQVGLITYMRTDSTHLSGDAVRQIREHVKRQHGDRYLPEKPPVYTSSNKAAQEAHEAIRPTDVERLPERVAKALTEDQSRLYRLIWQRAVSCQMTPAQWDSTAVLLERADVRSGAVLKTTGRVLVFDGFYRVAGVPTSSDEQTLPALPEGRELAPFDIDPEQLFTNPPPRYSEASLVKALETEGIGRPSTYAQIIQVIQDRSYVEQVDRRFHATDLGEVVTDKLIEGFPSLMDPGYTRRMEEELDEIESAHTDWTDMLRRFYERFSATLEHAHETMQHAKAETQPAIYQCPRCGSRTVYRFGRNGRFLSCSAYPKCDYGAPIDRDGRPLLPEEVDMRSPVDGSPMVLRTGRFGKFLASVNYPDVDFVVNLDRDGKIKYPAPPPVVTDLPCPKCEAPLNLRRGKRGPWLGCSRFPRCRGRFAWSKLDEPAQKALVKQLDEHEREHPQVIVRRGDGTVIPEGSPVTDLLLPGSVQELAVHPDAKAEAHTEAA